ncbi:MAG: zinc-ribbon domain-containing protein [Kofleriaceae bacterium]|nr:zinc-ribbon domain-containing protein [Kofleriaceae bacterium]
MDVRCEKCNTEYELDEARLKPGGVTVKCTTCGHMFKIRKRSPTQGGIPVVRAGTASAPPPPQAPTAPRRASRSPAHGVPRNRGRRPARGRSPAAGERSWILRLDNGETRQCREPASSSSGSSPAWCRASR